MKRLLFFPGHRILAYEWQRGRFHRVESFEPDEAGRQAFQAWLAEAPRAPVQMLVDVIEEEFHVDHVPHVIGRDRIELFRRTAEKHFRQTELRYIVPQGREQVAREGATRRDDRVLIAGLTNPGILDGWLSLLEAARVPLKAIHSLPLVGERLLPALGAARSPRALVISQQIPSTLRQSYYEHGRLRFSRLVPGRYEDAPGFAAFLRRELRQTLHFLETHRFRRREDPVEVFVIIDSEAYHALRDLLSSSDTVICHLVPLEGLSARVGIRGGPPARHADQIFAHTLLRQRHLPNHYGLLRLRRHFFVQRARLALAGVAAACVLASVAVGAGSYLRGQVYEAGAREARARTETFERLYQQRLRQLDAFDHRAVDVKQAVDRMSELEAIRFEHPGTEMAAVADAIDGHEDIVLDRLAWRAVTGGQTAARSGGGSWSRGDELELSAADAPLGAAVRLEGDVVGFAGDYRRGVESFDAFVAELRSAPAFARVEVVAAPFDLESDSVITGESGTSASDPSVERASFALVLQRARDDEAL